MPSATDLASLLRCAHRIYLDAHGDASVKVPTSVFLQLLWEGGRSHEDAVIAGFDAVPAHTDFAEEDRIAETGRLMREGHRYIYHGYFRTGDLVGEPDLLERVEVPSKLGDFAYIPVDIKAAGAFEKNGTPKEGYLAQLSAYAELIAGVQGWLPDRGKIIDGDGVPQEIPLAPYAEKYRALRALFPTIRDEHGASRPGWKSDACTMCPWQTHCWHELEKADDLTTVAGVGEGARAKLVTIGVSTALQLSQATEEALLEVHGIGPVRAKAWIRQARAQKAGVPEILEPWAPPAADFEVSYDIEDFTPNPFVYLHGLLVREKGDSGFGAFDPVCAAHPQDEEAVWRMFLEKVAAFERRGNYVVYVYSHHEQGTLAKLAARYGGTPELDTFTRRFVDLYDVVRRCVVFPSDGQSLKSLARYMGFEWRDEDAGGAQSMAWWDEYWRDPVGKSHLRERVIAYNEDDVRASFVVRDWLEKHARVSSSANH